MNRIYKRELGVHKSSLLVKGALRLKQYLELVDLVLKNGQRKTDRTGTGTLSVFGTQSRYNLQQGFPLLTTKKVLFNAVVHELLWFLRGSTNINANLTQHTPIWDAWADEKGELGPIYGYQWRKWPRYDINTETGQWEVSHIDQIQNAINLIKSNPDSRRIIVSAWNVADVPKMALPPCHLLFQFYVINGKLDCQLYQRSADIALGVPFNIASYSLLIILMAHECGLLPGEFIHTIGDAHIYLNHVDGLKMQLQREPLPLPEVSIGDKAMETLQFEDFRLENYQCHPFIKFEISV